MTNRGNTYTTFLGEYLKNVKQIGSIVPDSHRCLQTLLRRVPFDSVDSIVEFGSGSGTVTKEIIRRKRRETPLYCFEKNDRFHERLNGRLKAENVHLYKDDAFNSRDVLASRKVDCIISTLPCSCLNFYKLLRRSVLPLLSENGVFVQYMHTVSTLKGFRVKPYLEKCFDEVRSDLVFMNFPPTLVYSCRFARAIQPGSPYTPAVE
jgi:phospholipid N-methyltransferase